MDQGDGLRFFELTEQHLKLLSAAYVTWNDAEAGAPGIDPKRPYGNGDVDHDIYELLNPAGEWDAERAMPKDLTPREWELLMVDYWKLHRETETALQIVLRCGCQGVAPPGMYVASRHKRDWRPEAHGVAAS